MNVYLRLGLAALCVAAAIAVAAAQEKPASLHAVAYATPSGASTEPNASVPWDGRPIAVAFLEPLAYNETRDATLAGARFCSHRPCGPLVWIRGDLNASQVLNGPFLLRPTSGSFTIEDLPLPPPDPAAPVPPTVTSPRHGSRPTQYDHVRFAVAEPFEMRSVLPTALGVAALRLAPLLLLAFVPDDVAPWRRGLVAAAALGGAWLGYSASDESWGILGYAAILFPMTVVGVVGLIILVAVKKRVHPEWLAVATLGIAFFLALGAFTPYAPAAGIGD